MGTESTPARIASLATGIGSFEKSTQTLTVVDSVDAIMDGDIFLSIFSSKNNLLLVTTRRKLTGTESNNSDSSVIASGSSSVLNQVL